MSFSDISLSDFAEHLRLANPFDDNRVTQIDSLVGDIPNINGGAFEQLKLHAEKTARNDKGRGVVVSGSPGIGKSHLLARFGQWARSEKYPFVYLLNLQAGPNDILRTILRTTISILTRDFSRAPWNSRLFKIVSMGVKEAITQYAPDQELNLKRCRRVYFRMLEEQNSRGDIYNVLWLVFDDIQRRMMNMPPTNLAPLAVKWLSGECLDAEQAAELGLDTASATEEGTSLSLEEMKDVLRVLCQFAAYRKRSFILCFDQVDTLSEDQVQIWSATVHALLDLCPGLLVVTSGVDETFLRWTSRDLVAKASWDDRIRQFPVLLSGIDANAARELIRSRLATSCQPFESIREVAECRATNGYFPLNAASVEASLHESDGTDKTDLRPRDVISRAGAAWEKEVRRLQAVGPEAWFKSWTQGEAGLVDDVTIGADQSKDISTINVVSDIVNKDAETIDDLADAENSVDSLINRRLQQHLQLRAESPEALPVDAGNLTGLLMNILTACVNSSEPYRTAQYGRLLGFVPGQITGTSRPAFQLIVEQIQPTTGTRHRVGVTVADAHSGIGATNMLKRIIAQLNEPDAVDEVVLLLDGRQPFQLAAGGKERLKELNAGDHPFAVETLSFEQYAALEALESVVGLAKSGDLALKSSDGEESTISEDAVYESHHRERRYLNSPLLKRLIGAQDAPAGGDIIEGSGVNPLQPAISSIDDV